MKKITFHLKAVASDRRIDIVVLLSSGEQTLGHVAAHLKVVHATAYFHIAKMLRERLVQRRREGNNTYYALTPAFRRSALYRKIMEQKDE